MSRPLNTGEKHVSSVQSRCMLELNTEEEGFMAYTAREEAQRPRAVYAINPDFRGI